jgi:DNA-directed RNA polymerase subunit L
VTTGKDYRRTVESKMELKVLKKTKNGVKLEIDGEGHSFCNILQKILIRNKDVEFAGYNVPHPLTNKAIVEIRVKGNKKPEKILITSAKEISSTTEEFKEKMTKAVIKYKSKAE